MNRTLSLIRYARTLKGWRRGSAVVGKNGKLKPNVMIFGGEEIACPEGRYQMVRYRGKRAIYTDLGNDAAEVMDKYRAAEAKQKVVVAAVAAGIAAPDSSIDTQRKTIKQYAADFLTMHRNLPHRSNDSLRAYTAITESFLAVCKATYPDQITQDDVIRWHGWMRKEKGLSDRTAADRYKSFRGFLKYCGVDPKKIIDRGTHSLLKKYVKRVPNTYSKEVVDKLVAASTDDNRALLWEFAYKTGLRDSELRMVTRHDLHGLDTDCPTLHVKERDSLGRIKDNEERAVELHPALAAKLAKWCNDNPKRRLVFGTSKDKPDTKMLLALKVTARRAGLNCGCCKGCLKRKECKEFTLHRFRRTYVTRMLRATGGDLRSVMERSGHSDIQSVMRYLEPAAQIRQAVANAFD